jgi:hypothetical protein
MQRMFGALAALTARSQGLPGAEDVAAPCAQCDIVFAPPA